MDQHVETASIAYAAIVTEIGAMYRELLGNEHKIDYARYDALVEEAEFIEEAFATVRPADIFHTQVGKGIQGSVKMRAPWYFHSRRWKHINWAKEVLPKTDHSTHDLYLLPRGIHVELIYVDSVLTSAYIVTKKYATDISDRIRFVRHIPPQLAVPGINLSVWGVVSIDNDSAERAIRRAQQRHVEAPRYYDYLITDILSKEITYLSDLISLEFTAVLDSSVLSGKYHRQSSDYTAYGFTKVAPRLTHDDVSTIVDSIQKRTCEAYQHNYAYLLAIHTPPLVGRETSIRTLIDNTDVFKIPECEFLVYVDHITWRCGPHGTITPTIVGRDHDNHELIEIPYGTAVSYKEKPYYAGDIVSVRDMGGIHLVVGLHSTDRPTMEYEDIIIPTTCPHCKDTLTQNGIHLTHDNESCPGILSARIKKFLQIIGVPLADVDVDIIVSTRLVRDLGDFVCMDPGLLDVTLQSHDAAITKRLQTVYKEYIMSVQPGQFEPARWKALLLGMSIAGLNDATAGDIVDIISDTAGAGLDIREDDVIHTEPTVSAMAFIVQALQDPILLQSIGVPDRKAWKISIQAKIRKDELYRYMEFFLTPP